MFTNLIKNINWKLPRLSQQFKAQFKDLEFPASIFRLDNGLTFIHQYLNSTPVVATEVWVRAGASAEPDDWFGMAHFLEHMIFKGSKHTLPGVFNWVIENNGGMTNAVTSHDYAQFFITTAVPYLADTLPCLADILLHAAIPEEEFVRERDVVLEEIRSYKDDPDLVGYQTLYQSLYQDHPYGRSILGEEEQVMSHSPERMRCFHASHYQPENMTVVIVGGIEQESALSLVNQTFSQFSVPSECPPTSRKVVPRLREIRRNQLDLPGLAQARLLMGWTAPRTETKGKNPLKDAFALDMLSVLLASGRSSRLVQKLMEEKQLVLNIRSDFSLRKEAMLFTISAWLEPQYLEQVEAIIRECIWQLQTGSITEAELARCQRLLCNDYAFSTETPSEVAGLYGYYNTIATAESSVTYPHQIKQLTSWDLQSIAKHYLSSDRYAVTVLRPV